MPPAQTLLYWAEKCSTENQQLGSCWRGISNQDTGSPPAFCPTEMSDIEVEDNRNLPLNSQHQINI